MKKLIKTIEFSFILAFSVIGWIFNGFSLTWALILFIGYLFINLLGYANKSFKDLNKNITPPPGEPDDPEPDD